MNTTKIGGSRVNKSSNDIALQKMKNNSFVTNNCQPQDLRK